ncbi:MAG: DUF99 family protein [Planctomycetota bacterium]
MSGPPPRSFVGVDDGPFDPDWRGDVPLVGVVYVGPRLDGVVTGAARRDGRNATERIARLIEDSRFDPKIVLLGGIAVAGFNVVDIHALSTRLGAPVLVVARKRPNLARIREVLHEVVPGGARKWRLIERAGPMEPLEGVWVQRAGMSPGEAARALRATTLHGRLPEPLRVAHLLAGALVRGHSRGGA